MGRKIPKSRKHKKIKSVDPFRRGARPTSEPKDANRAPKNLDQEIPGCFKYMFGNSLEEPQRKRKNSENIVGPRSKKLRERLEQEEAVNGDSKKKKLLKKKPQCDVERPICHSETSLKRLPNETREAYAARLNDLTRQALLEADLQKQFDVDIIQDEHGTRVERSKNMISRLTQEEERAQTRKNRLREQKKREKKQKEKEEQMDKEFNLKEDIPFGEVVQRPPDLTKFVPKKRKADAMGVLSGDAEREDESEESAEQIKPGKKNLLLKQMLSKSPTTKTTAHPDKDLTIKRKKLSESDRKMLDEERERLMEFYRTRKMEKLTKLGRNYLDKFIK